MKRLQLLLLFALILTFNLFAQNNTPSAKINFPKTEPAAIVGTWRLIEFTDLDTIKGEWIYRYGKNPKGYFTYTKSGIVNLNISTDHPMKISEDSAKKLSTNLFNFLNTHSLGYFGTYTVDLEKSIVTHHVKGGCLPWYIDTDQPRPFSIKADTLIINNNKTWKRVLVRAD